MGLRKALPGPTGGGGNIHYSNHIPFLKSKEYPDPKNPVPGVWDRKCGSV